MNSDDICYLSAVDLRGFYERRELSPVEVTEAVLSRIDRLNPDLNAFITVCTEVALGQARAAERDYAGHASSPIPTLAGLPISIKDLTPTKGVRTTRGSLIEPDWIPDYNPPFVERVLNAGAVMLGKTNTPEFGWKGDSGNRLVGPTHNPWKQGRTAGGSSGGAAAAVAAGLGPLAQGSDGAGSIRIPAAFCGIFGFKPSFGLVPQYPASAVGDLSHLGPMTRTVRDAALLLDVTAGSDARDRLSWSSGQRYSELLGGDLRGLRVAWSPDLGYAAVEPDVATLVSAAARRFENFGCVVEDATPALPDPWDLIDLIWGSAMAGLVRDRLDQVRDLLDPGLLRIVERGNTLAAADVAAAQLRRATYYQGIRQFMDWFDLLLTPQLPLTAFPAGANRPEYIAGRSTSYLNWTPFTYPFNLTGQPAASVPCGFASDGLPVALQIVGRWHDDATVLRAARCFEDVAPWVQHRPPVA